MSSWSQLMCVSTHFYEMNGKKSNSNNINNNKILRQKANNCTDQRRFSFSHSMWAWHALKFQFSARREIRIHTHKPYDSWYSIFYFMPASPLNMKKGEKKETKSNETEKKLIEYVIALWVSLSLSLSRMVTVHWKPNANKRNETKRIESNRQYCQSLLLTY